jgi:hypothetical protein
MRQATIRRWNSKTEKEKLEYSENSKGDKNPNWKGGLYTTKFVCPICGKETGSLIFETTTCKQCRDISGEKNYFFGQHHTNEAKEKIRNSQLGKKHSKERIEKSKISSKKFFESDESIDFRKQVSIRSKNRYKKMSIDERIDMIINSPVMRMVVIDGFYYFTATDASKKHNVTNVCIINRCNSKNKNWDNFQFVDKEFLRENKEKIIEIMKNQ